MTSYPMSLLLSKLFLKPKDGPEHEFAGAVMVFGVDGIPEARERRFRTLRTGEATWETPGFANLPKGLDRMPAYWDMPWASKIRKPVGLLGRICRRMLYESTRASFVSLVEAMEEDPWPGPPARVIELVDPPARVGIYTDGNRRIGIASVLGRQRIPATVCQRVDLGTALFLGKGRFSETDIRRWWDHCFSVVYGDTR